MLKTKITIAICGLACAFAVSAGAKENVERDDKMPPPPIHRKGASKEELQMMQALFSMSDEQLARMRGAIEHIERTPIKKRKQMAEDLARATSDDPAVRQKFVEEMRERFEREINSLLAKYYASIPEEQAKEEAAAFLKMSKKEQRAYVMKVREKLGIKEPRNEMRDRPPRAKSEQAAEGMPEHARDQRGAQGQGDFKKMPPPPKRDNEAGAPDDDRDRGEPPADAAPEPGPEPEQGPEPEPEPEADPEPEE
ncbi:MAG: hypothetical protein LUD39_00720 [Opitutae bacterium]|nr:hypothetical protein [Opitutae bacterium]MCD8298272.1 hypothetical protein [Opitutae bacterium]